MLPENEQTAEIDASRHTSCWRSECRVTCYYPTVCSESGPRTPTEQTGGEA